jgi:UDP-glucose 4,6-dehydratase
MHKIFISGGAGFVGSHLCEKINKNYKKSSIIILDKLTYAGNKNFIKTLIEKKNVTFIKGNLCDIKLMKKLLKNVDLAINVAAESHVDNSFNNSFAFTITNTLGSHVFFENCRINKVKNIIHVSTDEVYGQKISGRSYENDRLLPTNPYSASKAAAEMIALSYKKSFKMNITIVRSNNLYGIRQYPEKLIPKTILSFLTKKKMKLHGNGQQIRHYLHIDDFTDGILLILKKKIKNEIINFGSNEMYQNKEIVKKISKFMKINTNKNIKFVKDRPFNDIRYSVSFDKIKAYGWKPFRYFNKEILVVIDWYKNNINMFKKIK